MVLTLTAPAARPPQITLLHGLPRSGTSLLGMLLAGHPKIAYRYQPLVSYALRDRLHEFLGWEGLGRLHDELRHCSDPFINQSRGEDEGTHIRSFTVARPSTMLIKQVRFHNHLLDWMRHPYAALIMINRKPEDLIISQLRAYGELGQFGPGEDVWKTAEAKNGGDENSFYGYARIADYLAIQAELSKRYKSRLCVVDYEDLVAEPLQTLERILAFLQMAPSGQIRQLVAYLFAESGGQGDYDKLRRISARTKKDTPETKQIRAQIRDAEKRRAS